MKSGVDPVAGLLYERRMSEHAPEKVGLILSEAAIVVTMVVVVAEVVLRRFFHYSLDIADELGGYMLVAMAFFSLSVCQARNAFHRVELLQERLSPRGRTISALLFDILALIFISILVWQLGRLVRTSWITGETSISSMMNSFMTPLWLPRLAMPIGAAALCYTLVRRIIVGARAILTRVY